METAESSSNQENHFLAKTGETEDPEDSHMSSESLLQSNEATSIEIRHTLSQVVPGLQNSFVPASTTQIELMPVLIMPPRISVSNARTAKARSCVSESQNLDPTSDAVRQKLLELVPGLSDYSFWEPICPLQFDVRVVHVTLANSSTSGVTSSSGNLQTGSTRKVVLESSSQPVESTTPANIQVNYTSLTQQYASKTDQPNIISRIHRVLLYSK